MSEVGVGIPGSERRLVGLVGSDSAGRLTHTVRNRNAPLADLTFFGAPMNLHTVWDYALIDHEQLSFTEWADWLDAPLIRREDRAVEPGRSGGVDRRKRDIARRDLSCRHRTGEGLCVRAEAGHRRSADAGGRAVGGVSQLPLRSVTALRTLDSDFRR